MTTHENSVIRFLFEDLDIRGALVNLSGVWQEMLRGRDYAPQVQVLLGEMTAVAALIGSSLNTPGRLTFQAQGHGDVSLLVVDCEEQDGQLNLRGMARCAEDVSGVSALELLGDGNLQFSLQSAMADMPYQSHVSLAGANIAEIFEHFLSQSVQHPARLTLFADGRHAAGLLLQTLPPADRENHDEDGWNRIQSLAATLDPNELLLPAATLLRRLFADETIRMFDPCQIAYHCPRDEDKVRGMLSSLGRDEVVNMLAEHGEIVIQDDICNHEYRFGAGIVDELFPSAGQTLH